MLELFCCRRHTCGSRQPCGTCWTDGACRTRDFALLPSEIHLTRRQSCGSRQTCRTCGKSVAPPVGMRETCSFAEVLSVAGPARTARFYQVGESSPCHTYGRIGNFVSPLFPAGASACNGWHPEVPSRLQGKMRRLWSDHHRD